MDQKLYSVEELMEVFHLKDRQSIYNHFNRGLRSFKIGKRRFVRQEDLDAYFLQNQSSGTPV